MSKYWKTWDHGKTEIHLNGFGDSYTLCGLDTAGDDSVHDRQPEQISGTHRITCEHCQGIIGIVLDYIKEKQ
jgi:hypothetical protein